MSYLDQMDQRDAERIVGLWKIASDTTQKLVLNTLAIPFPAHNPVESAKMAMLNLTTMELEELWDWMGETHQLPPGVN